MSPSTGPEPPPPVGPDEIAGPPAGPVEVPAVVTELAERRPVVPVWRNQLGGLTFRVGDPAALYVKWQPAGGPEVNVEAERLDWLSGRTPVPVVVAADRDDDGSWLATEPMDGDSAVAERWRAEPGVAVRGIGAGLRAFHDAVPVDGCPFDWSTDTRLRGAGLDPGGLTEALGAHPTVDVVVVCHGDACAPNTLLADDGSFVGHVDVGSCGVADRWADLAVASWSLEWNYGPGWDDEFFGAYGIEADRERIEHFRRLWALT